MLHQSTDLFLLADAWNLPKLTFLGDDQVNPGQTRAELSHSLMLELTPCVWEHN